MRALGIFEGGGVRGYAHVGALKACEDRGIEFTGIAGTSIGAIVAVLVAAGYTSDDLYAVDDDGRETGLFACDIESEFLDAKEYARLRRARDWCAGLSRLKTSLGSHALADTKLGRLCARLASAHSSAWSDHLEYAIGSTSSLSPLAALVAPRHWRLLRGLWARSGALSATRFTNWLDERLRERLGKAAGETVTFADIDKPLVLIAANLSREKMTLFQRDTHERMPLAAAAMASAAYPFVFAPQVFAGEAFVDGGIVSNFPAWALDGVRTRQPEPLPTFGFRVIDAPLVEGATWPGTGNVQALQAIRRIVTTAAFGREVLESRRIDDLHPIEVVTAVKATDFHLVRRERANLYRSGRDQVRSYFAGHLGPRDRSAMTQRLLRCIDIVREVTGERARIRAYLVQPVDDVFARVVHSALHEGDADDALLLRRDGGNQALCMARREPVLLRDADLGEVQRRSAANKYVHALRPTDVTHAYTVPMFDAPDEWRKTDPACRNEPLAAFCVDFVEVDQRLLLDPGTEDVLAALADGLVDCWKERVRGGPTPDFAPDQAAAGDWTPLDGAEGFYVSSRKIRRPPPEGILERIGKATA